MLKYSDLPSIFTSLPFPCIHPTCRFCGFFPASLSIFHHPVRGYMLSCFSPVQLFVIPWTVACQAPLSIGLSRQEYWGGLPCPPPGDLPNPGIEPPLSHWGSPNNQWHSLNVDGETVQTVSDFIFLGSKITADGDCSHKIKRHLLLGRKVMTDLDSILKSRDISLPTKGPSSQGYGFSSGHVWMWELDCEESWAPKNWCFWTVVLEKTLERLQGYPTSPFWRRSVLGVHWKEWC